jgi:hypothetical protein
MEQLIRERQRFENEMYDLLVNVDQFLPPEFWEPVVVKIPETFNFEKVVTEPTECFVCFNEFTVFNKLNCCKKKLCEDCTKTWFDKSVKCPFCVQDIRTFS